MKHEFRVHPSIGFARVGNSEEYNLAPESMAALPLPNGGQDTQQQNGTVGGLPLRPNGFGTITSRDIRDNKGRLKRQAARFKIYAYPEGTGRTYPSAQGVELTIGTEVDGKEIVDIVWTVHLANKKANAPQLEAEGTIATSLIAQYENGQRPPLRNIEVGQWAGDPQRVRKLTIDPGPRAIKGSNAAVDMDATSPVTYGAGGNIKEVVPYPRLFPAQHFDRLYEPNGAINARTAAYRRRRAAARSRCIRARGRLV